MEEEQSALQRVLQIERADKAHFSFRIEDGWQQGRGAFGGVVLGALLRAVEASEPDAERRLRSLTGEIVAPVLVGEAEVFVEAVRIGKGVSTWGATLRQGGAIAARASVVLGRNRRDDHHWAPEPPEVGGPWQDVAAFPSEAPTPTFTQHFEYRNVGPLPFSGSNDPEARGWIRPRAARVDWDAASVLATADAWWPASLALEPGPRPVATVAFTLQLFSPDSAARPGRAALLPRPRARRPGRLRDGNARAMDPRRRSGRAEPADVCLDQVGRLRPARAQPWR